MFETSFIHVAAAVSAPALLTNASALLLGGANHRYQVAIDAEEKDALRDTYQPRGRSTSTRIALSAGAIHAFHVALMAFGIDCVLLLTLTVMAPVFGALYFTLDALGTAMSFVGLAGLLVGIVLMASEGLYGLPVVRSQRY